MTTSPAGGGSSDVKAGTPAFLGGKGATVLRTGRGCLQKKPAEAEGSERRGPRCSGRRSRSARSPMRVTCVPGSSVSA